MDIALKRKKQLLAVDICSIVMVFALMWVLNSMLPYLTDDMLFKFVFEDNFVLRKAELVKGIPDMLVSMKNYYNINGGRIILQFICYFFVFLPKWIFNIANSLMFVLLGLMLRKLAMINIDKSRTPVWLLPLIYIVCLLYMPSFGDVCLWLSGSVNYLWSGVLLLFCCYLMIKYVPEVKGKGLLLCAIPIIFSSCCNETTGGMLFLVGVFTLIQKRAALKKYIYCFLCTLPWAIPIILAKGNYVRADAISVNVFSDGNIISTLELVCEYYTYLFNSNPLILILFLILVYIIYIKKKDYSAILWDNGPVYAGVAGVLVLCLTGFFSPRPVMLGYIVYLSGILKLALEAVYKENLLSDGMRIKSDKYYKPAMTAAVLAVCLSAAFGLTDNLKKYCHDIRAVKYCFSRYADLSLDKSEIFPRDTIIEFQSDYGWLPPTVLKFNIAPNSPFIDWYREYCKQTGKTGLEEFYIYPD